MINIISKKRVWFIISSVLVVGSLVIILSKGLAFGIDFTGGSLLEFELPPEHGLTVKNISERIIQNHPELKELRVQTSGENQFIMRAESLSEETHQGILTTLSQWSGEGIVTELRFESIGPTLGNELKRKAIIALIIAVIIITAYIAWSFRKVSKPVQSWKYGIGAIVALVHDVIIATGIYVLAGSIVEFRIDALFVTALLVILGYSVNDTIVVYDRIRENVLNDQEEGRSEPFADIVNKSLKETFARSVYTSFTTLLVLIMLLLFGGASIQGFIFTLIVGIIIGTYSSLFLASPLLLVWEQYSKKRRG